MPDRGALLAARGVFGEHAALWARDYESGDGWWLATTGSPMADFNVGFVGVDSGGDRARYLIDRLLAVGAPGVLMVAPDGAGESAAIESAGWRPVADMPFLRVAAGAVSAAPVQGVLIRELTEADLPEAQAVQAAALGLESAGEHGVLTPRFITSEHSVNHGAFAGGRMLGCHIVSVVDDTVVAWGTTVRPDVQRRGVGRLLNATASQHPRLQTVTHGLALVTDGGAAALTRHDTTHLEDWRIWSRPRWMLGRS